MSREHTGKCVTDGLLTLEVQTSTVAFMRIALGNPLSIIFSVDPGQSMRFASLPFCPPLSSSGGTD
jgi:hypothetical protein